jgi:hypothetical protein
VCLSSSAFQRTRRLPKEFIISDSLRTFGRKISKFHRFANHTGNGRSPITRIARSSRHTTCWKVERAAPGGPMHEVELPRNHDRPGYRANLLVSSRTVPFFRLDAFGWVCRRHALSKDWRGQHAAG